MIVRDEAERLADAIASLPKHDQLVIVDTGSTDNTVEIARAYGAQVEHYEWRNDFADARNFAESFATCAYIFWIDGDETLIEGHDVIRAIVASDQETAVRPACRASVAGDGAHLRQELLRRRGIGVWKGAVHEYIDGPLGRPEPRIVYQHHERTVERDGKLNERFTALWQQLGIDGPSFRTLGFLAKEHAIHANWAEAAALAQQALECPDGPERDRSELAIIGGNALAKLGQDVRARSMYLRAIGEWDGWAEPYFAMGASYVGCGRSQHAIAWLMASFAFEPADGHTPFGASIYTWRRHAVMGAALGNLGNYAGAREYLRVALEVCPDNDDLKRQLAMCDERLVTA